MTAESAQGALAGAEPKRGRGVLLRNQTGTSAMKNFMYAGVVLAASATLAFAQPIDQTDYRYYSYRDHYRAYGINSLTDGSLPPDEFYVDPCYKWVNTPRGLRKKFVCRS
jgi:hypothetical protein